MRAGEKHFGGGTPIGHIHIQPGEGDGVLDDGRNSGRWWRQLPGFSTGSVFRAPSDLTKRPGEERSDLIVRGGYGICFPVIPIGGPTVVAEEGGVPEHIAATAHVHGVAEVSQRRAYHIHC